MKKVLSIFLTVVMVTSQLVIGFAADSTTIKTPGTQLQEMGLVSGYANGSLGEGDLLTRAQMMVLIAQLKGENEMAKYYALPTTYVDVDPYAWYAPYVAYAETQKWTAGISKTKFGPNDYLTSQQAATFMLKILGYPVTNYNQVMDQAYALGILKNGSINPIEKITRGGVFQYMLNTLNTPIANSSVSLGVNLGVIKPEKPSVNVAAYNVNSITALSNTLLEVKLNEPTTVAETKQFVIRGSNGTMLELTDATLLNAKTIWLTTKTQTAGITYTVAANKEFKFIGMSKDLLSPTLVKDNSKVVDFITVRLVFDKDMDPRSTLNIDNYKLENGITLLGAKFDKDKEGKDIRTEVLLTTSSQERNKLYAVRVTNKVTDIAGNSVTTDDEKNVFRFVGLTADTTAPRLTTVYSLNANKIIALFDDQSDLDSTNAQNIGNYTITNKTNINNPLNVTEAKLVKNTAGKYLMVELKTTQQIQGNSYELSIANVTDKFGNIVSGTNGYKASFTGQIADTVGPKLQQLQPISNTKVAVIFDEEVTKATAEVVSNYTADNDLSILRAERDEDNTKRVILTTSSQIAGRLYKIKATGVTDEYGNINSSSSNLVYFSGMYEDTSRPRIASATAIVEDSKTYVVVKFTKAMGDSAKVSANYYFGSDIGYGLAVVKVTDSEYKIRTNTQTEGKSYEMTIGNVYDLSGNIIDDTYYKATFFGKAVSDTEPPKINYAVTVDKKTVRVVFNRAMLTKYTEVTRSSDGLAADSDLSDPDNYKIYLNGSSTPINIVKAYVEKDKMTLTLRTATNQLSSENSYSVVANGYETADPVDGGATSLYASNGIPLSNSYASYSFNGSPIDAVKPRIASAIATSTNTIDIRFNTPIRLVGLATDGISITGNGQTLFAVPSYTMVSTSDNTSLQIRLSGKMSTGSTAYTINISQLSAIQDVYGDLTLDSSYGGNTATLYSNTIENDGPYLNSVVANDSTSITLSFSKELSVADVSNYRITTDAAEIVPNYAEFVDGRRDKVKLYFNSANMSVGRAYKVKIPARALADVYGITNVYAIEEYFGLSSVGRTNVTFGDFGAVGSSTLRIMFSKAIANTATVTSGASFAVTNTPVGTTWTIEKAYSNGGVILPNASGEIPQNVYYDMLDLKANKLLSKDTNFTISFVTPSQFYAKDGAGIDGTPSRTTSGQLNTDNYKLTTGAVTTATGSGVLKVTVTDANINSYNVRMAYAKVGVIVKASSLNAFATQVGVVNELNAYNMAAAVSKNISGVTEINTTGLTAGAYDVLVAVYNQKNEFIGYWVVTNFTIN